MNKDYICEECGIHFSTNDLKKSKRFCSKTCSKLYTKKKLKCAVQKRINNGTFKSPFTSNQINLKVKAKGNWKCIWCNKVFRTRREMQQHKKEQHPDNSKIGWSKGLTKETSEFVKRFADTISNKIKSGEIKPFWLGKHHSLESRNKMSKRKIELYRTGKLPTKRIDVKYYSISNLDNKTFKVQGTWELNVAKKLNELGILWTRNKIIKYKKSDGSIHRYSPDFYLPNEDSFIEVKGFYGDLDKEKMNLVLSQNNITLYFIDKNSYLKFLSNDVKLKDLQMVAIIQQ